MKNERSIYEFKLNCNSKIIEEQIVNYLLSNNFKYVQKTNESCYERVIGRFLLKEGTMYFKYIITDDNLLIINAWVYNGFYEFKLEQTSKKNIENVFNIYRDFLQKLFRTITNLNNGMKIVNYNEENGLPIFDGDNFENEHINELQKSKYVEKEIDKKDQEKVISRRVNGSFIVSIAFLLFSLVGLPLSIFLVYIPIVIAISGIKSKKKITSIVTIVICVLSFIISIFNI